MLKKNLDYKLVNLGLIALITYLVYQTGTLWIDIVARIMSILLPFLIAFVLAYALYPIVEYLENKKIKNGFAVAIVAVTSLLIIGLFFGIIIPMLFGQLGTLFDGVINFFNNISTEYNFDLAGITSSLSSSFDSIIKSLGNYISNGAIDLINTSIGYIAIFVIAYSAMIYFLLDFKEIRLFIKKFLLKKSKRMYSYFRLLDKEMHNYLQGMFKIMVIALFEYSFAFYVIGHPNALLLGFLAVFANLIPYFGGMLNNVLAIITAFAVSPALFFRTLITAFILSTIDGYVINPFVYGKSNKIHPIAVIFAVFAGGTLFGTMGIIISLPVAIILLSTFNFFKEDISDKIEDIKKR